MRTSGPAALWRSIVTETVEGADAGSRLALEREGSRRLDRESAIVLLTAVLCLTLIQFFGRPGALDTWRDVCRVLHLEGVYAALERYMYTGPQTRFHGRVFWSVTRALGFLLIPGWSSSACFAGRSPTSASAPGASSPTCGSTSRCWRSSRLR